MMKRYIFLIVCAVLGIAVYFQPCEYELVTNEGQMFRINKKNGYVEKYKDERIGGFFSGSHWIEQK